MMRSYYGIGDQCLIQAFLGDSNGENKVLLCIRIIIVDICTQNHAFILF